MTTSGKRQKKLLQNIHRLIAIPVMREMQSTEEAGVVGLREIDLIGEAGCGHLFKLRVKIFRLGSK